PAKGVRQGPECKDRHDDARPPRPLIAWAKSPLFQAPGAVLERPLNLRDYLPILIYLLAGVLVGGAILTPSTIGPPHPSAITSLPYESGILTTRPSRPRFSIDFYLTAMLFIVFDIELAFFYPLAVVLRQNGTAAVVELLLFTAVLGVAFGYIWRRGALEWR